MPNNQTKCFLKSSLEVREKPLYTGGYSCNLFEVTVTSKNKNVVFRILDVIMNIFKEEPEDESEDMSNNV